MFILSRPAGRQPSEPIPARRRDTMYIGLGTLILIIILLIIVF